MYFLTISSRYPSLQLRERVPTVLLLRGSLVRDFTRQSIEEQLQTLLRQVMSMIIGKKVSVGFSCKSTRRIVVLAAMLSYVHLRRWLVSSVRRMRRCLHVIICRHVGRRRRLRLSLCR